MKVLLTGATGFIGSHLIKQLPSVDWLAVVRSPKHNHSVETLLAQSSWGVDEWCYHLLNVNVVVHCAGLAHCEASQTDLQRVNVDLSVTLARAAAQAGVKRFLFLSSVKVIGEATIADTPFTSNSPYQPGDDYGRSKRDAELCLQKIAADTGMELVIIRPPLVYGPGVKANFHLLQKIASLPVPLPFASINNRRDMVAIENLCGLIECCLIHPAAAGGCFLVSDGKAYSLAGLLTAMRFSQGRRRWLFGVPSFWLLGALRLLGCGAMAERLMGDLELDITETKRLLGWQPVLTLEQALKKMNTGNKTT